MSGYHEHDPDRGNAKGARVQLLQVLLRPDRETFDTLVGAIGHPSSEAEGERSAIRSGFTLQGQKED
jgi:hypothetical protein